MDKQPSQPVAMTPQAIGRLGVNYWHGWGVPQDYGLAVSQFRIAAAGGDAPSNFWLGVAHAEGRGAPQDDKAARAYLAKAAQAGDSAARDYLATLAMKAKQVSPPSSGRATAYLVAAVGGALASLAAAFGFHQSLGVVALAFIGGATVVAVLQWLMRPEPNTHAAALAAVAKQQVHGSGDYDEGTI